VKFSQLQPYYKHDNILHALYYAAVDLRTHGKVTDRVKCS
jgi:hypothetical protein